MNRITSRLAARRGISQVENVVRADAAAGRVDRLIQSAWRQVLLAGRETGNPAELQRGVRLALHLFLGGLRQTMTAALARVGRLAHRDAVGDVVRTVPVEFLRVAAERRQSVGPRTVFEDEAALPGPGLVDLSVDAGGLRVADLLGGSLATAADIRSHLSRLLFPPPTEGDVLAMLDRLRLGGASVRERLNGAARRFDPDRIAAQLAISYSQGKTQREIAKDMRPAFDGLRVNAARLARTYGLAVAGAMQRRVDDQLGDLSVGVQVHATLDQHTRTSPDFLKNHRARNGTIFYKEPGPGQYGIDKAPQPPLEYDGEPAWN